MRRKSFGDFVDKKKRESIHQLTLLKQVLERNGLEVDNFLESEDGNDPYVFCFSPNKSAGFDGVRIYKIGNQIAFRVQKENKTHPYGSAYPIPVEDMFYDFMSEEEVDQMEAGKQVIESVAKEVRRFFEKSSEAASEEREQFLDKGRSAGNVAVGATGTDYSAQIHNGT